MKAIILQLLFFIPIVSVAQMEGDNAYKTLTGDVIHVGDTLTVGKGTLPNGNFKYFVFTPLNWLGSLATSGETQTSSTSTGNTQAKSTKTGSKPATGNKPANSTTSSSANPLSGGHFIVRKLKAIGSKKNGYIANAIIRVSLGLSYSIQIEPAIQTKEIIALNSIPFQSKISSNGNDPAQKTGQSAQKTDLAAAQKPDPAVELMKWKKLLDAGAINQHDYDSIKSKILASQ